MSEPRKLTPVQEANLASLRPPVDEWVPWDVRGELDAACLKEGVHPDADLWLTKHKAGSMLGCLRKAKAEESSGFEWADRLARGTISHAAVAAWFHEPDLPPTEAAAAGILRTLEADSGLGKWFRAHPDPMRFLEWATEHVAMVQQLLPPIPHMWGMVTESGYRFHALDRAVGVGLRSDITIGRGAGLVPNKAIGDFKTGLQKVSHISDMGLYALAETIKFGVPPRVVFTLYLDSGQIVVHQVTDRFLDQAVDRLAKAAGHAHRLSLSQGSDGVEVSPSIPGCKFCPLNRTCADALVLDEEEEDSDED